MADLLRALMLESANDAAVTIAEHVSGSRAAFVRDMNARARELGLPDTRFANPIGLDDPKNRSSAADLAKLTLQLRTFPFFKKTVDRPVVTLTSGARPRTLPNRNRLVRRIPWIDGVKTGHTRGAGYVLVGSGRRNGISLISVVLGTPSEAAREADTLALLRHGFTLYRRARPLRRGTVLARVPIRFRQGAELELIAPRSVTRVVRKGTRFDVRTSGVPAEVAGPISRGDRMGTITVTERKTGEQVAEVPLVAAADVAEAGVAVRSKDFITRPLTILLLVAAVGASVALILLRRRVHRGRLQRHEEGWAA
jgi:serine-type D-Ala-D-Ala carboxypeptidase (penicillin-binding protein 5/6)